MIFDVWKETGSGVNSVMKSYICYTQGTTVHFYMNIKGKHWNQFYCRLKICEHDSFLSSQSGIAPTTKPHDRWDFHPSSVCRQLLSHFKLQVHPQFFYNGSWISCSHIWCCFVAKQLSAWGGGFRKWKEWLVCPIVSCPKWVLNLTVNTDTVSAPLTMTGSLFRGEEVI